MILNPSPTYLLFAISLLHMSAVSPHELDKTPWKPKNSTNTSKFSKNARRQYNPAQYASTPSHSQAYSGPRHGPLMARPVTYVPPQVTFNPPQLVYGSPSVTRAVSSPAQYIQNNIPPAPLPSYADPTKSGPQALSSYAASGSQLYPNYATSGSQTLPSYAAPIQPYQYHLMTTPPPYSEMQQSSIQQYQMVAPPASMAAGRSYAPSHQGMQYQLLQPLGDAPQAPSIPSPYTITTPAPTTPPTSTTEPTTTPPATTPPPNDDNATFVDVVTVMTKYVRATGAQLSEMFTQLSNNTELNAWSWTTPRTTTTTPTPPPPPPSYQQPPLVVPMVYPIMMPAAPAPAPPPPPPPTYAYPPPPPQSYQLPPPAFHQPQPSYSQHQPIYVQPPPTFSQFPPPPPPPPSYHYQSHQPMFPQGKHANNEIMDNSIDHDYYYDCDK